MNTSLESRTDRIFVRRAVEAAIRISLVALLVAWCFQIVRPFIIPVVWGIIIAVAVFPAYRRLEAWVDHRATIAASLVTLLMLVVLIGPTAMLAGTLAESARGVAAHLTSGDLAIPPPPESVGHWPLIGEPLTQYWRLASDNIGAAVTQIAPQIAAVGRWLLSMVGDIGLGILQFVLAIIIAGVFLAHAKSGGQAARAIAIRFAGDRGADYADLGQATVRSVARGILGVALIQSLLAGLGFLAVGIPAAGLLALVCLLLCVVQIGPSLVLIGAAAYVFTTADTTTAVIFTIWCIFVALMDNVLRPLLLGRGVKVPMVVIFIGAIGGLLASGIIGLFIGAVVLALSFTLFKAWLAEPPPVDA